MNRRAFLLGSTAIALVVPARARACYRVPITLIEDTTNAWPIDWRTYDGHRDTVIVSEEHMSAMLKVLFKHRWVDFGLLSMVQCIP